MLEAPAATRKSNEFLHSPRPDTEVGPVVRNLMRKASAEYIDRGLSVLYLAFECWIGAMSMTLKWSRQYCL